MIEFEKYTFIFSKTNSAWQQQIPYWYLSQHAIDKVSIVFVDDLIWYWWQGICTHNNDQYGFSTHVFVELSLATESL